MLDVLVVGAGPTGLMMGCQLARWDVRFRIVDAQPDRAHESRAFGVQARSMELFDQLGLGPAFAARAIRADGVRIHVRGRDVATLRFDAIGGDTRFPALYLIPQSDTEQILIDELARGGVAVERRIQLLGFHQDADGVSAELANLETGARETVRCAYIVGCDGAHSTVREALAIPFEGATYPQELVLADARLGWQSTGVDLFLGRRGFAVVVALGEVTRVMGTRFDRPPHEGEEPVTLAEVIELVHAAGAPIALARAEWLARFRIHHRATRRYGLGRAFLAGDACHIHTPVGGQGMNTGLQDATNLAWKLALVLHGGPSELLETYERERQRVGEILVQTTDRAFNLLTSPQPIVRFVRDRILPLLLPRLLRSRRLAARIERFVSELDIHYHANLAVRAVLDGADDSFRRGLRAGRRVPDLSIGGVPLHELLRDPALHVLAFGPCDEVGLDALGRRHANVVVHRIRSAAAAHPMFVRFGVTDAAVYVVRPDGYVGFRSFGPSVGEAEAYLDLLFGTPRWAELAGPQILEEVIHGRGEARP